MITYIRVEMIIVYFHWWLVGTGTVRYIAYVGQTARQVPWNP